MSQSLSSERAREREIGFRERDWLTRLRGWMASDLEHVLTVQSLDMKMANLRCELSPHFMPLCVTSVNYDHLHSVIQTSLNLAVWTV